MNIAPDAPKRPALRYYGGKWNLAPWIISHFPPHKNYVEPCGGAASVLLQKPRSPLETYNDLDGNVVNFFRVLRDNPDELIRKIRLTPWAREEYEICLTPAADPIERARRFYASLQMSFGGINNGDPHTSGWRNSTDYDKRSTPAYDIVQNELEVIAARLIGVQIEHRDYREVVQRLDATRTLIYFDPPYVTTERTNKDQYRLEMNDGDHIEAAALLRQCTGYVIVSGYACPLYAELYEAHGWTRRDREAQTNSGGKRIESLWLSPRTWQALQDGAGLPLFSGMG
jgi:DNA adenine methylase